MGNQPPNTPSLRVVRAGEGYVVIDKPPGLLSVPGKGPKKQDCVPARVRAMFPACDGPLVVHRLDMDTSGLLVLGLTAEAQAELSRQFAARTVRKAYVAFLDGEVARDEGTIALPLRLDPERRPYQVIDFVHGREGVTNYRVLARDTDRTLLRMEPVTGRTHQLRVHAAAPRMVFDAAGQRVAGGLGAPIVGDVLYGNGEPAPRLMLHACELAFREPVGGAWVECAARAEWDEGASRVVS